MKQSAGATARSNSPSVKMIIFTPEFFLIPMKKVQIETNAGTDRTYFLHNRRIVAVGVKEGSDAKV